MNKKEVSKMEDIKNAKYRVVFTDEAGKETDISCDGFALLAVNGEDTNVAIMDMSVEMIKTIIADEKELIMASSLAVGETLARLFYKEFSLKENIGDLLKGFAGIDD